MMLGLSAETQVATQLGREIERGEQGGRRTREVGGTQGFGVNKDWDLSSTDSLTQQISQILMERRKEGRKEVAGHQSLHPQRLLSIGTVVLISQSPLLLSLFVSLQSLVRRMIKRI
jgi:hypothetical protein